MLSPPPDRIDDEIYEDTLKTFPELAENNHAKLVKLNEEGMNPEGKERWRVFIESCVFLSPPSFHFSWAAPSPAPSLRIPSSPVHAPVPRLPLRIVCAALADPSAHKYKKKVKDYNLGSLIRTDAHQDYGGGNTIFSALHAWSFLYIPFPHVPLLR
jgi:hypothetical protein